jgi:hypothetical protein
MAMKVCVVEQNIEFLQTDFISGQFIFKCLFLYRLSFTASYMHFIEINEIWYTSFFLKYYQRVES